MRKPTCSRRDLLPQVRPQERTGKACQRDDVFSCKTQISLCQASAQEAVLVEACLGRSTIGADDTVSGLESQSTALKVPGAVFCFRARAPKLFIPQSAKITLHKTPDCYSMSRHDDDTVAICCNAGNAAII